MMAAACGGILRQLRRFAGLLRAAAVTEVKAARHAVRRSGRGFGTAIDFQSCVFPEQDQSETESGDTFTRCAAPDITLASCHTNQHLDRAKSTGRSQCAERVTLFSQLSYIKFQSLSGSN